MKMEIEESNNQNNDKNIIKQKEESFIEQKVVQIAYKLITKQSKKQNIEFIVDLKNIFARQLPKMPKEYIVKLIMDIHHQSIVIIKNSSQIIGGVCFRQFQDVPFVEIAFLAISSSDQVKGYGTKLMNKLKEQIQSRKYQSMMTFADNFALGFFKKQGFSSEIRIPSQAWKGKIKDYQGGTIMECYLHPSIDYSKISDILSRQKTFVFTKIKEISLSGKIYKGQSLNNIASITRTNKAGIVQTFKRDPFQIPGIKQTGWSWQDHENLLCQKSISYQAECQIIIELMKKHPKSWPFRQPVNIETTPDYILDIPYPMDLKTIEKKLSSNEYPTKILFCQDIKLMFDNCRKFNQPDTTYYKCAKQLEEYIKPHLKMLQEATNIHSFTMNKKDNSIEGKKQTK